jgi:hypothetical protein
LRQIEPLPASAALTARRGDRAVATFVHSGLRLAVLATLVVFSNAALDLFFAHASWQGSLKLVVGVVLTVEGLLLATNWLRARSLLLQRLLQRHGPPSSMLGLLRWRLLSPALTLVGAIWAIAGIVEIVRGIAALR